MPVLIPQSVDMGVRRHLDKEMQRVCSSIRLVLRGIWVSPKRATTIFYIFEAGMDVRMQMFDALSL